MRRRSSGDHTALGRRIALAFTVASAAAFTVVGAKRLYLDARAADPFENMLDWFERECAGGYVPPGLSRQPDGFRGIVLPNPVKKGDTVLNVPRKCAFLTSDAAQLLRDEGFGELASRRHAQVLVLGAMVARRQKSHFLAPYFDTWPTDTSNFPTNWPADGPRAGRGALAAARSPTSTNTAPPP